MDEAVKIIKTMLTADATIAYPNHNIPFQK